MRLRFTATLFAIALLGCPQQGDRVTGGSPSHVDLRNRFAPREIIGASELPPLATRIKFLPSSSEFVVLGKGGEVSHFELVAEQARRLGSFTLPEVAPAPGEIGLTDVAFDPQFHANGLAYFCYSTGDNRWNRIVQVTWSNNYGAIGNSVRIVLNVDRVAPARAWHGIYSIAFGSDGYLYAALGDATQPQFAQDPQSLLGKLLRLEPRQEGGYSIPPDNPYVGDPEVRDEIVALGLRSPFRLLPWRNHILIGDVGSNKHEEINRFTGNANFGWPECEGVCNRSGFTDPILAIAHQDPTYQFEDPETAGELRHAIALGVVHESSVHDPYQGLLHDRLLFNDVFLGYVRAAELTGDGQLGDNQHLFHLAGVSSMDVGADGFIYGTTIFEPSVFRVQLQH